MKILSNNLSTILALPLMLFILSGCEPNNTSPEATKPNPPPKTEITSPPPAGEITGETIETAGFCNPGNPNTPRSQLTGTGDDCDIDKSKSQAISEWLSLNCSGNADPQCPSGCVDPSKKCQAYPGSTSNLNCTPRDVSASICPDQVKYKCEIVQPSTSQPISCSCTCL